MELESRFRADEHFRPLIDEAERRGLLIGPVYLYQHGSLSGYSNHQVVIQDHACGLHLTDSRLNWSFKISASQLHGIEFVIFGGVDTDSAHHFFIRSVSDLIAESRQESVVRFPLSGPYHYNWHLFNGGENLQVLPPS